jgi:hypothetical protein
MRIRFKSQEPTPQDAIANLAPEQQRRVIEYGSGDSEPAPPGRTTTASAPRSGSSLSWIDRALDGLEPLAE